MSRTPTTENRPEFMVTLGLAPPYTVEDVKQAYLMKVKTAHPDVGGDAETFRKIQEAFERGTEYAQFHQSRRRWMQSHVERYIQQQEFAEKLATYGGTVESEQIEWVMKSFDGDFAQLVEKIVAVELRGPQADDRAVALLVEGKNLLGNLRWLDLSGSKVTDEGVGRLAALTSLERLNLRDTGVTWRGLRELRRLPVLKRADIRGTHVGWWGRLRLRWAFRHLKLDAAT